MAEHDLEKIVEAGGDVFNFRDPTKQPVTDRVTSWSSTPSDSKYPSEKLVKDSLDSKVGFSDVDAALSATSTNPLQNKEITRWINLIIGDDGYVSGSSANPQLSLEKVRLGAVSLYNKGVTVKIYSFAENDEANAVLRWDSSAATGNVKTNYDNGLQTGTLYQSSVGEWVKITYTGSTSAYFRAIGIFLDTKDTGSGSTRFRAFVRVNGVDYPQSDIFNTFGSLVVAAYSGTPRGSAEVILKPYNSSSRCRIYGFRCLNTYTGSDDAVLIGTSTNATKLRNSRKLAVSLSNTSTDTSFNGSADVTNIKTTGTLGVGNGGTGRTSVTAGRYVVGAGTSALVEKTAKEVGSNVLSSLDTDNHVVQDSDYIVASGHEGAQVDTTSFVRRTAVQLWTYIAYKIDSVLGLTASAYGGKSATAGTADTAKAYDPTFSGTNSIASALESKVTEIAFTEGNASAATDLTNVVLCGLKYTGSSLSSGRLSFTLSVTIDRGSSSKGGILRVDLAIGSDGSIYCKRASLTARSGGLEISEFRLVTGTNGGKPVVGVVWNGTTTSGAYMDVRVIDYMALSASASFVYDVVLSNVSNVVWGSSNAIQSASDSDVVHISGSETITGSKEFSRSGQETNFTDSSGSESIVRARTSTSSNNGSCQLNADRTTHRFGVYGRNENGTGKWVSFVGNDGVVNLGNSGDEVRIGGTKFVFNASQLGTEADTFYWI